MLICRICGMRFSSAAHHALEEHVTRCFRRHEGDLTRPPAAPFEGDPELAAFARAEGDVYNRRPGTRRQPH
jgi:hypothetical protein